MSGSRVYSTTDVLEKWAEYAEYDPEQTSFNLLSSTYEFNRIGKRIEILLDGYDQDGVISVLYAKDAFMNILRNQRVKIFDVVSNPDALKDEQEMYDMFMSDSVKAIENGFLESIDKLIARVAGAKLLTGDVKEGADAEETMLHQLTLAVDAVTEELPKCNKDLFSRGGTFRPIQSISKRICVYPTIADCLIDTANAPDAAYLCYIGKDADIAGYFGILIKNNGNTVFVNERVNEEYIGAHLNSRNNRWLEGKKTCMFPYEIIEFSGGDYKGYATSQSIDESELGLFALSTKSYLPIVLAVLMLSSYFTTKDVADLELKYTDRLLPVNTEKLVPESQTALIVMSKNEIVTAHKGLDLNFDTASILDASAGYRFDYNNPENAVAIGGDRRGERGYFTCNNQFLVDLWGKGFWVDTSTLLKTSTKLITSGFGSCIESEEYEMSEFVGTEKAMAMQTYLRAREALALYMRNAMFEEYVAFGGVTGARKWREQAFDRDYIQKEAIRFIMDQEGVEREYLEHDVQVSLVAEDFEHIDRLCSTVLNQPIKKRNFRTGKYICNVTGKTCSIFVTFTPKTWKGIEYLIQGEVPLTLKGWLPEHNFVGNHLLNASDPVNAVGTPFEVSERTNNPFFTQNDGKPVGWGEANEASKRLHSEAEKSRSGMSFDVGIGFSKRGLAALKKQSSQQKF